MGKSLDTAQVAFRDKRRERRQQKQKGRIIVLKEKHGTRYFLADTEKKLAEAALSILKERMTGDYRMICSPGKASDWYRAEDILTDAAIAALPTESVRSQARREKDQALGSKRAYEAEGEQYHQARRALRAKDGDAALEVLQDRSACEYEGFRFEYLENIKG